MPIVFTRAQVRRVDQLAVSRYGISGLILMENAGRSSADILRRTYGDSCRAAVFCGVGNNGGDGCVIARHLHNMGWSVRLLMTGEPERMTPDTLANFRIIETMGLQPVVAPGASMQLDFVRCTTEDEVIVDALLGTGFHGDVREPTAGLIQAVNASGRRVIVSVDVPSGLDCDTGIAAPTTIRADVTITFVACKAGFAHSCAEPYVGRVEVADIGAPRELIEEINAAAN